MLHPIEMVLEKLNKPKLWDNEPVFCFTADIDWASEDILKIFFKDLEEYDIHLTTFVTHHSPIIEEHFKNGKIERGIHPNFLAGSSHGNSFKEVIDHCIEYAPEAVGFRCHRLFDVSDITHLLKNQYGFKYVSNLGTILGTNIRPILHESGLIHFPTFFEDGTHLYNKLNLNIEPYESYFSSPGIKIISFHPMNFVLNSPSLKFMREIKDSLTREEYNNLDFYNIEQMQNKNTGIKDTMKQIFHLVSSKEYKVMALRELYEHSIS